MHACTLGAHLGAVIMACVVCVPFLLWFYRRTLTGPIEQYDKVLEEVRTYRITDWALFSTCGAWAWERCKGQGWGWSCVTLLGAAWSGGCTGVAVSALQERSPARFPTSAAVCLPCPACAAYVTGVVLVGFLLHPVAQLHGLSGLGLCQHERLTQPRKLVIDGGLL